MRKRASSIFSGEKKGDQDGESALPQRLSVDVLLHAIAPAPVNPQPPQADDGPPLLEINDGSGPRFGQTLSLPAGLGAVARKGNPPGRLSQKLAEDALKAMQPSPVASDDEDEPVRSTSAFAFQRIKSDIGPKNTADMSPKGGGSRESLSTIENLDARIKSEHERAAADARHSSLRSSNHSLLDIRSSAQSRSSRGHPTQRHSSRHSKTSLLSGGISSWKESILSAGSGMRKAGSGILRRGSANVPTPVVQTENDAPARRSSVQSIASQIASLARASKSEGDEPGGKGDNMRASGASSMDEERFHRSTTEEAGGLDAASAGSLQSIDVIYFDYFFLACPRAIYNLGRRMRNNCLRAASQGVSRVLRASGRQQNPPIQDSDHMSASGKPGQAPFDCYSKAETAFNEELADVFSDGSSDALSDIEEHPWQEYFIHRKNYAHSLWDLAAGVPTSESILINKIGIRATKKKDLREFLRSIKGSRHSQQRLPETPEDGRRHSTRSEESDKDKDAAPPNADLSEVLGDALIDWSYYDLFEPDRRHNEPLSSWMISGFSVLARMSEEALLCIAFYSTWYATLVYTFREVIAADRLFGPDSVTYRFLESLDVVLDSVYLLFTLLRLRMTIVDSAAYKEVTRPRAILRAMLTAAWFWGDLLTSLVMPVRCACGLRSTVSLQIGVVRVLRVWRVVFPPHDPVRSARWWLWSMLKFVLLLLLAGHLWGCMWFWLADSVDDIEQHPLVIESAPNRVAAFHETPWALALYYTYAWRLGVYLVIGADWVGMSSAENLLAASMAPIGALISALVFSQVIVMMQRDSAVQTMYAKHVIEVKQALATLDLPRYLQLRILAFYAYQQLHRSEHVSHSLRRALSPQLQFELHLVLYYGLVKKSRLFHSAPPRVLREIVVVLKDRIFLPGDFVYRARDEAKEMFFICKGCCSVLDQDLATQHQMLRIGDSFGEIPLLCGHPHISYIRAGTYCILAILSKGHFECVIRIYPKMAEILLKQMSQQERELMQKRTSFQAAVRRRSSLGRRFSQRVPSFSAGRANSLVAVDPSWQQKLTGAAGGAALRTQRRSFTEPGGLLSPQMGSAGFPIYSPRASSNNDVPQRSTMPGGLSTPRMSTAMGHMQSPRLSTASMGTVRSRQASMLSGGSQMMAGATPVQQWKHVPGNRLGVPNLQRMNGGTPVPVNQIHRGTPARSRDADNFAGVHTPMPPGRAKLQGSLRQKAPGDSSSSDEDAAKDEAKADNDAGGLKSNLKGNANRRKSISEGALRRKTGSGSGNSAPPPRRKSMMARSQSGALEEDDKPKPPVRRKSIVARQSDADKQDAAKSVAARRSSVMDANGRRKSIAAIAMEAGHSVATGHGIAMGGLPGLPGLHPDLMPHGKAQEQTLVEEQLITQDEVSPPPPPASPIQELESLGSLGSSARMEAEMSHSSDDSHESSISQLEASRSVSPQPGSAETPLAAWGSTDSSAAEEPQSPRRTGGSSARRSTALRSSLKDGTSGQNMRSSLTVPNATRPSRGRSSEGGRKSVTVPSNKEPSQPAPDASAVEEEDVVPFSQSDVDSTCDEAEPSRKGRKSVTITSTCEVAEVEGRKAADDKPTAEEKAEDTEEAAESDNSSIGSSNSSTKVGECANEDVEPKENLPRPRKMSITVQNCDEDQSEDGELVTSKTSVRSIGPVSIFEIADPPSSRPIKDDDDEDNNRPRSISITVNSPDAVVPSMSFKSVKSDGSNRSGRSGRSAISFTPSMNSMGSARSGGSGIVDSMTSYMKEKGNKIRAFGRRNKADGGRSMTGVISKAFKHVAGSLANSEANSKVASKTPSRNASQRGSRHASRSASRTASQHASKSASKQPSMRGSAQGSRNHSRRPSAEPKKGSLSTESMQLAMKLEELLHHREKHEGNTRGSATSVLSVPTADQCARYSSQRSSVSGRNSICSMDYWSSERNDSDDDLENLGLLDIPATIHATAEQMAFASGTSYDPAFMSGAIAPDTIFEGPAAMATQSMNLQGMSSYRSGIAAPTEAWSGKKGSEKSAKEKVKPLSRRMSWPCSKRDFSALQARLQSIVAAGAMSPDSPRSEESKLLENGTGKSGEKFGSSPARVSDDKNNDFSLDQRQLDWLEHSSGLLDMGLPLTLSANLPDFKADIKAKPAVSKTEHNTHLMAAVTDSVVAATKATRSVLKDLNLVSGEMRDLTKAVVGISEELREATPQEDPESQGFHCMENSMDEGGFGAFEVTQTMDMVLRQIKHLQSIAEKVAMQLNSNQGADEVIIEAMTTTGTMQTKLGGDQGDNS